MDTIKRLLRLLFGVAEAVSRGPYLLGLVISGALLAAMLAAVNPEALGQSLSVTPAGWAAVAIAWWSSFALLVKRLRDIGLGWGWSLLLLVPGLQFFVLLGFALPKGRRSREDQRD